jgi:uncharacterized DUF497 family protein
MTTGIGVMVTSVSITMRSYGKTKKPKEAIRKHGVAIQAAEDLFVGLSWVVRDDTAP